jgi:hypothetical protein
LSFIVFIAIGKLVQFDVEGEKVCLLRIASEVFKYEPKERFNEVFVGSLFVWVVVAILIGWLFQGILVLILNGRDEK